MQQATNNDFSDIALPIPFAREHPELFTEPQIDWLLKTRHKNGLAKTGAVLKVSGKLYINKPLFIVWFNNQIADGGCHA